MDLTTRFTIISAIEKHTQSNLHEKTAPPKHTHLLIKKLEWKRSSLYLFFPPVKNKQSKATVNIIKSAFHSYLTGKDFVILPDDLQMQ